MGHGFRFLLAPFSLLPPLFQNFHINHSFYNIFIIIRFSSFDNISRRHTSWIIHVFCAISVTSVGKPSCLFYTFYLVYIWHCRIELFLRHLPNCPCSNFSRYIDLFQEISPRIAKQLRFQVKLHHLRRKCKNDNPGLFANAMKNPDALRIFFPKCFGGNINRWKKHNSRRIIS